MSIVNRRNAVIGWATWTVFKQLVRRNVKAETKEEPRSRRWRGGDAARSAKPKKHRKRRALGFLMATAVGVGVWFGSRRRGGGEPVE